VYDRRGILLESFNVISERLEKCLPPTQDQPFLAEAVFPLTPPLSDDSDVSDGCRYKGKSSIKTIHAGGTADRLRKLGRNRPRIQHHRTHGHSSETFTLHLVSRDTGKPTIAAVTDSLFRRAASGLRRNAVPVARDAELFKISVSDLQDILEVGDRGYGPPDLMIVHNVTVPKRQSAPLQLSSFPPWQVRLTEIHYNGFSGLRDRWMSAKLRTRAETWIMLSELDFRRALDEYSNAEFRLGK
jgi:dehydrodolichyl diphosphate syntase complex subunit NUS1